MKRINRRNRNSNLPARLLARTALACTFALSAGSSLAMAEAPAVVTSIKPLQSIAAAVMEGVGTPAILIDGAASPHGFALKPSQASLLQRADAVFWIGPELAPSLEKPITSMAENAVVVELMEAEGIEQLDLREGANFDPHDHGHEHADGDHDHDHDHDASGSDHDDEDHHGEHADHDEAHGEHAEDAHHHDHGDERDPHIWLNPDNGIAIANAMAATLADIDPEHADTYRANAASFASKIGAVDKKIAEEMAPISGKGFIVFHDGYHHFEHHYGVEASGAITLSPEALASADRVEKIRDRIQDANISCVFQEPQFDAKLVTVVMEGSDARKGTLDPLGTEIPNGPDLYPTLLENLAASMTGCLGQ